MNIVLFGGFFGSGKTTVISRLIPPILRHGRKVCIIENEVGKNAIDDLILETAQIEINTISGGCVCCEVTGNLIYAIQDLESRLHPDWLIIELTGIAFLDTLRQTLLDSLPERHPVICVSIIDAARWARLLRATEQVISNQVRGGDIIVINKTDLNPEIGFIRSDILRIAGERIVVPMSAKSDCADVLLDILYREAFAHV